MPLSSDNQSRVDAFLRDSAYTQTGAVITDLDGTAVLQVAERVMVPEHVERGLERVRSAGRPAIVNTLRFPLSIIRTFGKAWVEGDNPPLPCITLNGSLIGDIGLASDGMLEFRERIAFPLASADIEGLLGALEKAVVSGLRRIVLFIYPRAWEEGEIIWTPDADRVAVVASRYISASQVYSGSVDELRRRLADRDICMMTVLVDEPGDLRLAFQHADKSNFLTATGIDKRSGTEWIAEHLGIDLAASVGAGDTQMDTFLDAVGLSLHVGPNALEYRGTSDTLVLADPLELGDVLFQIADHCERVTP